MKALVHPTYMPNIGHFSAMLQAENLVFEVCDNYQKQTYRNRCAIYGPNGKLALTVPVSYTQKDRQLYKDVKIYNAEDWQGQHLKSLQTAYNMSPFFEFYEDELMPLFTQKYDFILDYNLKCLEVLCECLQVNLEFSFSKKFELRPENTIDFRGLANPKIKTELQFETYTQVFTEKHGFIENLSILDLLFNEGPNSVSYLERQNLNL
ncbi:WbqC family protein [Winogradskyella sp. A3E31]|uniref:WbqC family protein n=1 Tax=Winogradskyella sp. A3E31 TaxID=3349637 RepID=UPI00398A9DA0